MPDLIPGVRVEDILNASTLFVVAFGVHVYAQDRREKRREQAALVSAWLAAMSKTDQFAESLPEHGARIHVSNRSEQPVFNVTVYSLRAVAEPLGLAVLPPAFVHEQEAAADLMWHMDEYAADLALRFTDARGRHWERTSGKLRRVRWPFSRMLPRAVRKQIKNPPPGPEQSGPMRSVPK